MDGFHSSEIPEGAALSNSTIAHEVISSFVKGDIYSLYFEYTSGFNCETSSWSVDNAIEVI